MNFNFREEVFINNEVLQHHIKYLLQVDEWLR